MTGGAEQRSCALRSRGHAARDATPRSRQAQQARLPAAVHTQLPQSHAAGRTGECGRLYRSAPVRCRQCSARPLLAGIATSMAEVDAPPARRPRLAVSMAPVAAASAFASKPHDVAVEAGAAQAATARVRESLTLQFAAGPAAAAAEAPIAGGEAEPAAAAGVAAAEPAVEPAAEPPQSISAWLQDERRAAKRRAPTPPPAEPEEELPLSLAARRAAARKLAAAAAGLPPPLRKPKAAAAPAPAAPATTFDFRAARGTLEAGGGLELARKSSQPRDEVAAQQKRRKAAQQADLWPFGGKGAGAAPQSFIKPGKRSQVFPRSGNRTQTFTD